MLTRVRLSVWKKPERDREEKQEGEREIEQESLQIKIDKQYRGEKKKTRKINI